jgi:hypothetical protein
MLWRIIFHCVTGIRIEAWMIEFEVVLLLLLLCDRFLCAHTISPWLMKILNKYYVHKTNIIVLFNHGHWNHPLGTTQKINGIKIMTTRPINLTWIASNWLKICFGWRYSETESNRHNFVRFYSFQTRPLPLIQNLEPGCLFKSRRFYFFGFWLCDAQ